MSPCLSLVILISSIISSSPERLVSVQRGAIETRPIAGTRPRSDDEQLDVELASELMAHPKIAEAAVIGVAHEKWGEAPLACVVKAPDGADLTEDEVLSFLEGKIAKWQMPKGVIWIDEVPKTSVGKFSKKTLRDRYADALMP